MLFSLSAASLSRTANCSNSNARAFKRYASSLGVGGLIYPPTCGKQRLSPSNGTPPIRFSIVFRCSVHSEQVDELVKVGLRLVGSMPVRRHRHCLNHELRLLIIFRGAEVGGVADVCLVGLRLAVPLGDAPVVNALFIMHDGAALFEVAAQCFLDSLCRRLAVAALPPRPNSSRCRWRSRCTASAWQARTFRSARSPWKGPCRWRKPRRPTLSPRA